MNASKPTMNAGAVALFARAGAAERRRETVHERVARLLVADDRPAVRATLAALLGACSELARAAQHPNRDVRKRAVAKYDLAQAALLHELDLELVQTGPLEQSDKG